MKRVPIVLSLLFAAAMMAYPQETAKEAAAPETDPKKANEIYWKWANFALLAGGLGYLIGKNAPAFFQSRTDEIRKGIDEAAKLKADAETRAADMEKRMSALGSEIEELKREAQSHMQAESGRIREETAALVAKIQKQSEKEIVSLTSQARHELKAFSAELAIDLAAARIREQMTAGAEDSLVRSFVRELERQGSRN